MTSQEFIAQLEKEYLDACERCEKAEGDGHSATEYAELVGKCEVLSHVLHLAKQVEVAP